MTLPALKVEIDFANGASFAYPFILDDPSYGILDTNVLADAPTEIYDISDQVMRCSIRRGRNRILSNFEAGTATVVLNDPDADFSPQNAASPYWDPVTNSSKVVPLRKIRIYATTTYLGNPIEINLFAGYISSYDTGFYLGPQQTSTVVLQCVDGFRLLNNVTTGESPVPGCTTTQLSGTRIDALLDFAGFPTSMRSTFPGQSTMQADPGGSRSVLQAIQTVEQSEFGAFFMQRSGKTLFFDRNEVIERADAPIRIYSDTGAPGVFPYQLIDFAFDDQLILNDVTVTRYNDGIGPALPQEVTDAASIARFFKKSGQRTDILVQTDQEANDQARTLLAARKNADLRIDSITVNNYADISELNQIINLSSDIYNLIFVEKQMPGGSNVTKELFIQGVQHDVTPTTWTTKLLTAEPLIQGFILDSQLQGLLGDTVPQNTNTLSY